ncbi:hypothetical protein [Holdemania massiliensis]|uniref:hypothetical protein n=1 Tax=Holdemania massiliensis TaxID=1468449 RepID=UPI003563BF32
MKINGKERVFEYNFQAYSELSKMCKDENLSNMADLFGDNPLKAMEATIDIAIIMNKAFEDHKSYDCPSYTPDYLTRDDFRFYPINEINDLQSALMDCMKNDSERKVEGEEPKNKKKENQEKSN